jgi:hypothetical protein
VLHLFKGYMNLPIYKIEPTKKLDEADLKVIKERIEEDLNEYLLNFVENYHYDNEPTNEDLGQMFKDNWLHDFDYMIDRYPNLVSCKEDEPELWEIETKFIKEWAR